MEDIAIVVDSNVIFAAIVREMGLNRYVVTVIPAIIPFYYPKGLKTEIVKHVREISRKSRRSAGEVLAALREILEGMSEVEITKTLLQTSAEYVNDVSDAPFVAAALLLKEKYKHVIILTWNVKDYREKHLWETGIAVSTPEEFMHALKLRYKRTETVKKIKTGGRILRINKILLSVWREDKE